jgi:radical SAM superfamily enzyme YgiQ (UPF0313 family)
MGLALIAALLEKKGYPVTVVDDNALQLKFGEIAPLVSDADVVGLSATTPTINIATGLARHLKQAKPDLTIVLGGPHPTLLPQETMLASPDIDIVIRGEGEATIIELLQSLESKQPLANIAGISYRQNGKMTSTRPRPITLDLDSLPFLAYHLLPWRRYRPRPPRGRLSPFAALLTSRGCPYHCNYCSKAIFGQKFRGQSPARVVDEIIYLKQRFGIKEFAFYDDVFSLNQKRAYAIADEILKRGLKVDWTCETRVDLVGRELLNHLKQAGCYSVAYGIESGSQEIIDIINKEITLEQAEEAVQLSSEAGLQTIGYFMIGNPGETPETVRQTIRFARKLKLDFVQFSVTIPYPGCELYELYLKDSKVRDIPWESFVYADLDRKTTPVFETSQLSREALAYWLNRAYREFYLRPGYIWQRVRKTTSLKDLKTGIKGLAMLLRNI